MLNIYLLPLNLVPILSTVYSYNYIYILKDNNNLLSYFKK